MDQNVAFNYYQAFTALSFTGSGKCFATQNHSKQFYYNLYKCYIFCVHYVLWFDVPFSLFPNSLYTTLHIHFITNLRDTVRYKAKQVFIKQNLNAWESASHTI